MDVSRRLPLCGCAALFSMIAGCVAPYPYSPYGGYPGQISPGPYGAPGMISPTPNAAGASNSGTFAPTPLESSADSSSSDAPPFNPTEDPVPTYPDAGDVSRPRDSNDQKMFDGSQGAFDSDGTAAKNMSYDQTIEPKQGAAPLLQLSAEAPQLGEPTVVPAKDEFIQPADSFTAGAELKAPFPEDNALNPFAHDADYKSLRGLVSFDDDTQTWAIMYNDRPGRDDAYGGLFTLADNEGFGELNENDVVYVEGNVSKEDRDSFGKPKYVVEFLTRLQPAAGR